MGIVRGASRPAIVLLDWIENFLAYIAGGILVFLALATAYDVVIRNITDHGAPWAVEVSEVGMVYATFLSAAWILRLKGHVALDTVVNMVSPATRKWFTTITMAVAMIAWAVIVKYGLDVVLDDFSRGLQIVNILSIPRWLALAPIPAGSLLMALECLRQIVEAGKEGDIE